MKNKFIFLISWKLLHIVFGRVSQLFLAQHCNKKILPKTTSSVLKMLFLLKIYKNRLITGSVSPY